MFKGVTSILTVNNQILLYSIYEYLFFKYNNNEFFFICDTIRHIYDMFLNYIYHFFLWNIILEFLTKTKII